MKSLRVMLATLMLGCAGSAMAVGEGDMSVNPNVVNPNPNSQPTRNAGSIRWLTNYDEALQQAKATSKPVVLLFTGRGWCPYCVKLEEEVFNTSEFANAAGNRFIFVLLDFPRGGGQDARTKEQNQRLQNKFNVGGYPTVVVVDSNGQMIGQTGYQPGGGSSYARHLLQVARQGG